MSSKRASSSCCARITDVATRIAAAGPNFDSQMSPARAMGSNGNPSGSRDIGSGGLRLDRSDEPVGSGVRVGLAGQNLISEVTQQRSAPQVAHALPQRGDSKHLDLLGGSPPAALV